MRKQEFLNALGEKLKEGMTSAQILSQVRYYEGYIDGEIAKGKTEEEAVEDLGDPILIARNILESPGESDDSIFGTYVQDQEDAYEEGNYQGENQHSEEEVRQAVREDIPLGETEGTKSRKERTEAERQSARNSGPAADNGNSRNPENEEDPYNGNIPIHDGDADFEEEESGSGDSGRNTEEQHQRDFERDRTASDQYRKESAERGQSSEEENEEPEREVKSGTGIFHDEYGKFRWDLLGVILAFAIGLTAVIWLITKIVAVLSPVVIIILLVIIIVFLVIHFRS